MEKEEVLHIAALSRLSFDDEQLTSMGEHLDGMLDCFRALDSLDTSLVSPTAHVLPFTNVLRPDQIATPIKRVELLKNAPQTDGEAFIVPKILE